MALKKKEEIENEKKLEDEEDYDEYGPEDEGLNEEDIEEPEDEETEPSKKHAKQVRQVRKRQIPQNTPPNATANIAQKKKNRFEIFFQEQRMTIVDNNTGKATEFSMDSIYLTLLNEVIALRNEVYNLQKVLVGD